MQSNIVYNDEARKLLKNGVDAVANAVGATLGPLGRNVAIYRSFGGPIITHDGVTVAKNITLENKFEDMGAKLILEAATKTNDNAGDGTTTATVLAQAMVTEGIKRISAGVNPMFLRRGLEKLTPILIDEVTKLSKQISSQEEIKNIAVNSAQDEGIGSMISDAIAKVGKEGVINIQDGNGFEDTLEVKDGMNFENGYMSPYFVTNQEKMTVEMEDAYILITDHVIANLQDIVGVLEQVIKTGRPILIIAQDIDSQTLSTLVVNNLRKSMKVSATRAPYFSGRKKDILEDIATITGGKVLSKDVGDELSDLTIEHLGQATRVISTQGDTTIIGGHGDKKLIDAKIKLIKKNIEEAKNTYEKGILEDRLAKLVGGVAIISVGGTTEAELKERKYRIEDAVNATKAAIDEGIVPGGGTALLRVREALSSVKLDGDEQMAVNVLYEALGQPFRKIMLNAGLEPGVILGWIDEHLEDGVGYDVLTGNEVDVMTSGIIDPAKVTKNAIKNAIGVTISILTTETLVCPPIDKD